MWAVPCQAIWLAPQPLCRPLCRISASLPGSRAHVCKPGFVRVVKKSELQQKERSSCAKSSPPFTAATAASPERQNPAPQRQNKGRRRGKLLDICLDRFPELDRRVLASLILQGKVLVEDKPIYKAGELISTSADLRIRGTPLKFVSRAGLKLEAALEHFRVDVTGRTALDAGLSTGGFADCLLQRGAAKVYGIDVGNAQVADALRRDPRMVVMERTNLRHLKADDLPSRPDLVTLDLSFISVLTVLPAVAALMTPRGQLVSLIKPQFEARKEQVEAGGVVTAEAVHQEVITRITEGVQAIGFQSHGIFESPVRGAISKNKEFFIHASFVADT